MRSTLGFLTAATLLFAPASFDPCGGGAGAYAAQARGGCCKTCNKGKACGDSCISRDKTCHKGKGCACDG